MRRRVADGSVTRVLQPGVNGRSMISIDSIRSHLVLPMDGDDLDLIKSADAGDAEAQTDLAMKFLSQDYAKGAIYWFELAVKQEYASAMYYLGRCYTDGTGVPKDENVGLIWILKAAVLGHGIAKAQMERAREKLAAPAAL